MVTLGDNVENLYASAQVWVTHDDASSYRQYYGEI